MLQERKIAGFAKPVAALADTPKMSAQKLKEWFDSNSTGELKTAVNGMIDDLTGPGGAGNIGTEYGLLGDVLTYLREKTGSDKEYSEFLSFLARHTVMAREAYEQYAAGVQDLTDTADTELLNFLAWIAAGKIRASAQLDEAYSAYTAQLQANQTSAQTQVSALAAWIAQNKQVTAAEVRDWLDTIRDILSGDAAAKLLMLIQQLQQAQPTQRIATISGVAAAKGRLADCALYATEYAMGVGGIGEGPIGGGELVSQPLRVRQDFGGTLTVETLPAYAAMTETYTAGDGLYTLCPADGPQSLVLTAK